MRGFLYLTYHWKELLPVDEYIVKTNGILQDFDRKVLTLLYQPLIGSICYSLYMTLWSEIEVNRLWGNKNTHSHLIKMTALNLQQIFEERKKLEGIGLLKTYVKEDESTRTFIYEIQPPLSPKEFFNHDIFIVFLYNRVGKTSFQKLRNFFSDVKIEEGTYKEVTRSFVDVYSFLKTSELDVSNDEMENALLQNEEHMVEKVDSSGIFIPESVFDFDLFFAGISKSLIRPDIFNEEVKEIISKLGFLYSINPIDMAKIVMWSLSDDNQINIKLLREEARNNYQLHHGSKLPKLVYKTQPLQELSLMGKEPQSEDDRLIKKLDRISPYDLLKGLSEGVEPTAADLQIIENIMINQKLNPGVVNVLIYYVMLKTDMKLTKNYIDRIAGHWARLKVKTVKEAMDLAKNEERKYKEWSSQDKKKKENQANTRSARFSKDPEANRRLLMLGIEGNENSSKQTTSEITEDDITKSMQKMFEQLEGKGE